jgi:hypothetical protein
MLILSFAVNMKLDISASPQLLSNKNCKANPRLLYFDIIIQEITYITKVKQLEMRITKIFVELYSLLQELTQDSIIHAVMQ